jgi:hypothetical protein
MIAGRATLAGTLLSSAWGRTSGVGWGQSVGWGGMGSVMLCGIQAWSRAMAKAIEEREVAANP